MPLIILTEGNCSALTIYDIFKFFSVFYTFKSPLKKVIFKTIFSIKLLFFAKKIKIKNRLIIRHRFYNK